METCAVCPKHSANGLCFLVVNVYFTPSGLFYSNSLTQRQLFRDRQDADTTVSNFPFYPWALRAGGVLSSQSGRAGGLAGGCQTCGTHISVTAWRIFSIPSFVELSRPIVVHCHSPICPIWACPWAKNLSNLPQIGSRLCGSHISETAGWMYPI